MVTVVVLAFACVAPIASANPIAAAPGLPNEPPLRASWIDRTRPTNIEGWLVRSDLEDRTTREVLVELSRLGRRFTETFGPVGGRLRVWCFANRGEASDAVRTLLGGELEDSRQAAYVPDPVAGRGGVVVVAPVSGAVSALRGDIARAMSAFGMASRPDVPPWLAHGVAEWSAWSVLPTTPFEGVVPPASLRVALREAGRQGRWLGVDRLVRLDGQAWRANELAGTGPLQRAEAGILTGVLLAGPETRRSLKRMLESAAPPGATPMTTWRTNGPSVPPAALDEAVRAVANRPTTRLETVMREAAWLAEGRARLSDGEDAATPEQLRERLRTGEVDLAEACLLGSGRCPMPTPEPVVEWTVTSPNRWSGRADSWEIALAWRTLGGRTIGEVSVGRVAGEE